MAELEKARRRGNLKCLKCNWYFKDHVGPWEKGKCKLEIGRLYPKNIEAIEYWTGKKYLVGRFI